ncbi:MAG: hypothetical protein JWM62_1063, partial [Frankiales bacterium]|nr:hypothetical protein [Frankiales bacterium]
PDGGNVFYFAGHGIQTGDAVRLLGVDAAMETPSTLLSRAVELREVMDTAGQSRDRAANVILLDTCLDNPFGAPVAGLPAAPAGTLVAYAAGPGGIAVERAGHGVWTAALLQAMAERGGDMASVLADVPQRVDTSVAQATERRRGVLPRTAPNRSS